MNISVICEKCKAEFFKKPSDVKRTKRNFCSKKCQYEFNDKRIILNCFNCGKETIKRQSELRSKNNFCSRSCSVASNNRTRIGENHPNWVNYKSNYRVLAFKNFEIKCYVCEYNIEEVLQVHHIDKNRNNNSLNNLCILCPTHHVEVHKGLLKISGAVAETD